MERPWQIDLLGGLRVRGEERTITRFRTHKTGVLLAYLAIHGERAHSREELAGTLWPESDGSTGRLNLRVELASLRRQLEPPGVPQGAVLVAHRAIVQLNPDAVRTDVAAFQEALRAAERVGEPGRRIERLRRAVALYGGELLPGYYEEWVLAQRTRLTESYLAALRRLSHSCREIGDLEEAIAAAQQAIAADALCESAHEDLIQLYAAARRPADALRQYRALEQLLREEFGQEPSPPIRRFVAGLEPPIRASGARTSAPDRIDSRAPASVARQPQPTDDSSPAPHLPLLFTRFFGREAELAQLQLLLGRPASERRELCVDASAGEAQDARTRDARLITLTGPAGSGKTRLAIEAARRLDACFGDAIWFVPLADLSDPSLIPQALLESMRLPRLVEVDPIEQAAVILGRRPSLLVLDNLEHLMEGGREFVRRLRDEVPSLTCLVTSRQRLDLEGEREIPVLPLPVPGEGVGRRVSGVGFPMSDTAEPGPQLPRGPAQGSHPATGPRGGTADAARQYAAPPPDTRHPTPDTLMQCPSIQLFVDRAQAVRPDFQVTPRNAAVLASICARLEGMPLGIELAAAWAQTLTPAQMDAHLSQGFGLLVSRTRDAPPRHRSLRAAIEWSCRLLEPSLRDAFARLAVFRGGWEIEAAEQVCGDPQALARIAALCDRSLVVAEVSGDTMRYRLLEPLREYARELLPEDEWDALSRRHMAYYLTLAEEAEEQLQGAQQRLWVERLRVEYPNLQAALERSTSTEEGLRLAASLFHYWQLRGELGQGAEWLDRALSANPDAPPALRARALFAVAAFAYLLGDRQRGERLGEESLSLCERLRDPQTVLHAVRPLTNPHLFAALSGSQSEVPRLFQALGRVSRDRRVDALLLAYEGQQAQFGGDYETAAALHERSLAIYRELGDRQWTAMLLHSSGSIGRYRGDEAATRRCWEESLALYQELDDQVGIAQTIGALGYAAFRLGDFRAAEPLVEAALAQSRRVGSRGFISASLWLLGAIAGCRGQYERATALLEESLTLRRGMGIEWAIADTLNTLGAVTHAQGDYARARILQHEALERRRKCTDGLDIAAALNRLGLVALSEGAYDEAERLQQECLELSHQMGSASQTAEALRGLGLIACRQGDLATAEARLSESMALHDRFADRRSWAEGMEAMAEIRTKQEQAEEATRLHATANALRESIGAPLPICERPRVSRELTALRSALGDERFAAVWTETQHRDRSNGEGLNEVTGQPRRGEIA